MTLYMMTIAWLLGIIWGLYFKIGIAFIVPICFVLFFLKKKGYFKNVPILSSMLLFILCCLISFWQITGLEKFFQEQYNNKQEVPIVGTIISNPNDQEYQTNYVVKVESIHQEKLNQKTNILLNIKKEKNQKQYSYGNQIFFIGKIEEPTTQRNEGGFDYQQYLKTQNIFAIVNTKASQVKIIQENKIAIPFKIINHIAIQIEEQAYQMLDKQEASLLVALLIGKKENLAEKVQEAFRKSSLSHMLAVSGAHTSYVMLAITYLLSIGRVEKKKSKFITILFLLFFMQLTGNTPSVTRACYMAIYLIVSQLCHKRVSVFSAICFSMLLSMIQNPYCIFDVGFQLSYGGTIGIVLLFPILQNKIGRAQRKKEQKNILKTGTFSKQMQKISEKIKDMVFITLSANIILFPIILFHFNTFSLTFLLSNLLASPLMGILIILGFFTIFLSFFFLPLANLFAIALRFFLQLFFQIVLFTSNLPFSQRKLATPKLSLLIFYYLAFGLFLFYQKQRKKDKKSIKRKKFLVIFSFILLLCFSYVKLPGALQIHFIDVGQGDAMLVITPKQKTILFDGGGSENFDVGKNTLLPYLLDKGITKLNYIFISHFDSDHVKAILTLLEEIKVEQVIISQQGENSENYEKFRNIIKEKRIQVSIVKKGDVIPVEKEVQVQILWPREEQIQENKLNNNSIVAKLTYQNFSMLVTGDIEQIAEQEIWQDNKGTNELKSTILKVAHHGSKTSSTQEFLEQVKPKIALIGVGEKNTFGHPNQEVLERLKSLRYNRVSNRCKWRNHNFSK